MAKKSPAPASPNTRPANAAAERIERLIEAVEAVAGQLEVLGQVIDEIRDEFQGTVTNSRLAPHVARVTSMAKDPLDPRWAEMLNRLDSLGLPVDDSSIAPEAAEEDDSPAVPGTAKSGQQRTLWD